MIEDEVREYLVQEVGTSAYDLSNDAELIDAGVLDSMGLLSLVEFLEQRYDLDIAEEDLVPENFESIGAVATYVRSRLEH